jgi:hypothetical protein
MDQHVQPQGVAADDRASPWAIALKTPWVVGLAALLAVQLLAAIALSVGGRGALDPAALDAPLLAFEPDQVSSLVIEPGQGAESGEGLTLKRVGDGWVIAELADFPADRGRVHQLLTRLGELKRPLPVATSPEALNRHKVGDDAFERRLTLKAGDQAVATLILGDSPGYRRIFARPAGDAAVYDLDLPLYDVSDRRDDWLARDQLRVDRETIERVASGDWALVKGDEGWRLEGADVSPDQGAVDDLLSRLSGLSYRTVLGTADRPEFGQSKPGLELTLGLSDGTSRGYRISSTTDRGDRVLKSDAGPWYYRLSEFDLEGIEGLDRAKLLGESTPAEQTSGEEAGAASVGLEEPVTAIPTDQGASGTQSPPDADGAASPGPTEPIPAPTPVEVLPPSGTPPSMGQPAG